MTLAKCGPRQILIALAWGWLAPALGSGQSTDTFDAANLIVTINGQIGARPAFGAGIIFGREKDTFYLVTANHVVRLGNVAATGLEIKVKSSPRAGIKAVLLPQFDANLDLAVLRVEGLAARGIDVCALRLDRLSQSAPKRGDDAYAVGNPNGVGWAMPVRPDKVSETSGDDIVFESALIARGHSGGALLNGKGELIGLVQADEPPYGRALDMRKALAILKQWKYPVQLWIHDGPSPLNVAAADLDLGAVRFLLSQACTDVNAVNHYESALHEAIAEINSVYFGRSTARKANQKDLLEVVKLLMDAGANLNFVDGYGWTPLSLAATEGNLDLMSLLISRSGTLNSRNSSAVLCAAADRTSAEMIRLLLAHGADVNSRDERGESALDHAVSQVHPGKNKSAPQNADKTVAVLQSFIDAGATVDPKSISIAVENRSEQALRILLAAHGPLEGVRLSQFGLYEFSESNPESRGMALLLLSAGAGAGPEGHELIVRAVRLGWSDVVAALIKSGVDVNGGGKSRDEGLLKGAIISGHLEIARILLEAGANPNMPGPPEYRYKDTPLWTALAGTDAPDLTLAALLIAHGANVNLLNEYGNSLLQVAIRQKRPGVVEMLVKAGAKRISGPANLAP